MKKIALAAVLAGVSSMASANLLNTDNLYVQGNVGYSKLQAKEAGAKFKDSNPSFTIAVGKDTGNVRYVGDYTYFGKLENNEQLNAGFFKAELSAQSVGFSAIYDFQPVSGFTPYVGGRLGLNYLRLKNEARANNGTVAASLDSKKAQAGAGVLAGVQYSINPQLAVDAGVEYNYLGKVGSNDQVKLDQYGAKLGLRYNF
ncbi:outer membrane autotransporter barrel domain-containing protein [Moraxella cuniculi DSM 21768]|uniref:Outer membrane autotransporter barrel domain-containing protein n=1 Tax=Moraxella cuniculi DSM 21768 TaxID=1122245 RepID=A0A1N7FR51_9GAMM|nr:opacity family porin [Moraxella cuniculi]OOS08385.1 hypothetical protein B0189_00255 [Moraxella cuniculi]SIS02744.1 outer membrane autotransporter barrel domain-containing protein [Moraxella cuniculi DSM 21768]